MFGIPTDRLWIYPIFFGAFMRIYGIVMSSIWHDEGYTMWLLKYNPIQIIERTARDVHPPGYYLIAKPWVMIFGNSAFSIRFLSLLFSVGIIYLVYKIVEKVFDDRAAFWASMFVALSPFMVRFAQEARMYGVVAFFTTLGTYFLVKFIQDKSNKALIFYALSMTVAIYIQYYAFFVIMIQWIIVATVTPGFFTFKWSKSLKERLGIFNCKWWLAGLASVVLYIPWFPIAYKQVTRVSGSYWIKPEWINARTIPNNLTQFVVYMHLDGNGYEAIMGKVLFWLVALTLVGTGFVLLYRKDLSKRVSLFLLYGYLPMVLVFILSKVRTPVYQDRYFPFSAVAILALWGIGISVIKSRRIRMTFGGLVFILLILGNVQMHIDTSHQMKALSMAVKNEMHPGDVVLSGELYTFLDGTYYFGDKKIKLISAPVDGYGESSLFYDQQGEYIVSESEAIALGTQNRVFIVGKTGDKKYFSNCLLDSSKSRVIYEDTRTNGVKAVLYEN
ncbi:MAG: glycosyltransferase family 39 protein [Patescibacteria group bacterium]